MSRSRAKGRSRARIETGARRQAIDVRPDQRLFVLHSAGYTAFMHVLDYPPAPGRKLLSLLRRIPAWQA
jgi:uncharacterized protein (DUF1778 family)